MGIQLSYFAWMVLALGLVAVVFVMWRMSSGFGPTAPTSPGPNVLIAGGGTTLGPEIFLPANVSDMSGAADIYQPDTQVFEPTRQPMGFARYGHTATLLNDGRVLIVGGTGHTTETELYSPVDRTFLPGPEISVPGRVWHTSTLMPDGRVLIAGGDYHGVAEIFDPGSGSRGAITQLGQRMYTARFGHTATLLKSGKILIAGGYDPNADDSAVTDTAELFDPADGTFIALTRGAPDRANIHVMNSPRVFHTATLLDNGKVLIVGGLNNWGWSRPLSAGPHATGEIYDPAPGPNDSFPRGSFAPIGNGPSQPGAQMAEPRAFHTATLLNSGCVLIAGGVTYIDPDRRFMGGQKTADLWVPPDSDPWDSPTGSFLGVPGGLTYPRGAHTATKLSNGTVLVVGGIGGGNLIPAPQSGTPLNDAEIYDPAGGPTDLAIQPGAFIAISGTLSLSRLAAVATLL